MSSPPLVSVIIPTYRRWDHLCHAIESVFQQTFSNWEIIVVNDAGGEPQGKVIEILEDTRIKYICHSTNQGLAAARNTGIINSNGTYIMYLDDDDIFYPNHINTLITHVLKNNWDLAYTDAYEATYEVLTDKYQLIGKRVPFGGKFTNKQLWEANTIPVLSVMHHKNCIDLVGLFDVTLPVLEDWDMWLRMSLYYSFHHIAEITAEYRIWNNKINMSQNTSDDKWSRTKCLVYKKYVNNSVVLAKPEVTRMLCKAISLFVRKNKWIHAELENEERRFCYRDLVDSIRVIDWLKLVVKKPKLASRICMTHLSQHQDRSDA